MAESLKGVVATDELQELLQFFYRVVGVPLGVLDADRQCQFKVGWQPICSDFHRAYPSSCSNCLLSTNQFLQQSTSTDYQYLLCPNGLQTVVFPIRRHGSLLGVFFLCQFLHAPADVDFFRRQALNYGYDQSAYLRALDKVPLVSKARIDFLMQFFTRFINMLVRLGDENRQRRKAEEKVLDIEKQLEIKVEERTKELHKALNEVSDLAAQMNIMLRQVEQMAVTDTLTASYNRRKFDEVAAVEQQRALRGKLPFSVIMLDIDHFKKVNDRFGHSVGDQVLKQLCDVIRTTVRQEDMLIRWGGEEFLIVLPATQLDEAGPLAERIRLAVRQEQFTGVGQLTISLGVAQLRTEGSIDNLIQRVDQALYRAKQQGRDMVVVEDPE